MITYRIQPDGEDEPTLWAYKRWSDDPQPVARRCETPDVLWTLCELLADEGALGTALRRRLVEDHLRKPESAVVGFELDDGSVAHYEVEGT